MMHRCAWLRAVVYDRAGVAALEFAVLGPLLLLLILGIYDVGRAMNQSMRLETAARAAAEYAQRAPADTAGIQNAALTTLGTLNGAVVNPAIMTCICPGKPEGPCGATCAGMKRYINLSVQMNYSGLLLKSSVVLRGSAVARLR